jgi:aminoglycoside phosphotransferase (APT) family kinase protein
LPQIGIINTLYCVGDTALLRVPRDHPGHIAQARAEALAVPAARAAGVRTPRLLVYDDTCDLLPVPYSIVERVTAINLESLGRNPGETAGIWRALGRDLALLHTGVPNDGPAGALRIERPGRDPRDLVEVRAREGWFTGLEARWLTAWLERIAPAVNGPDAQRCLHLDVQATNILVRADGEEYLALIDWGCAGWGDPAWDFFGMPLRAVPFALEGHRQIARLDGDDGAEARVLWRHLQFVLAVLPRGATPGLSWGEHPLAWLLEVLRFFLDQPEGRWRDLRP